MTEKKGWSPATFWFGIHKWFCDAICFSTEILEEIWVLIFCGKFWEFFAILCKSMDGKKPSILKEKLWTCRWIETSFVDFRLTNVLFKPVFFFLFSAFSWSFVCCFSTSCRPRSNGDDATVGIKLTSQFHQKVAGVTFNVVFDCFLLFCSSR